MHRPFRIFLFAIVAYHLVAIALVFLLYENGAATVLQFYKLNANLLLILNDNIVYALMIALVALVIAFALEDRAPRFAAVFAFFGTTLLFPTFSMIKTAMPLIAPFFADPFWAELDRWMHFGIDPWKIVHIHIPNLGIPEIPAPIAGYLYFSVWFFLSAFMPALVALSDSDVLRKKRFVILFFACWIGLGNIFAMMGLSVGPVFYDRVYDSTRFAEFTAFYEASALGASQFAGVQQFLWQGYATGTQELGSGISAFPSVHVGMTTVFVLYFWERFWGLGVLMGMFWLFVFYYTSGPIN